MRALRGVLRAHTPPAVHPGMTIWGVKGGVPPHFVWAKSYFFSYLERQAKIQNHTQTHSGRKVRVLSNQTLTNL